MKKSISLAGLLILSLSFAGCFQSEEEKRNEISLIKINYVKESKPFNELAKLKVFANKIKIGHWEYLDSEKSVIFTSRFKYPYYMENTTNIEFIIKAKFLLNNKNNNIKRMIVKIKRRTLQFTENMKYDCAIKNGNSTLDNCMIYKSNVKKGIQLELDEEYVTQADENWKKLIKKFNKKFNKITENEITELKEIDKPYDLDYVKKLYLPMGIGKGFGNMKGLTVEKLGNKIGQEWVYNSKTKSFLITEQRNMFIRKLNKKGVVNIKGSIKLDNDGFIKHSSLNGIVTYSGGSYHVDCIFNTDYSTYKCQESIISNYSKNKSKSVMGDAFVGRFLSNIF